MGNSTVLCKEEMLDARYYTLDTGCWMLEAKIED
jgi:hypothetical protein